jgi:hypothetical protein
MGLDLVELVMSVEEHFGIDIPDRDVVNLRTPGHLIEYVAARVPPAILLSSAACSTQQAFYRLRRTLVTQLAMSRAAVHPSAALDAIFPIATRRKRWRELSRHYDRRVWPVLALPSSLDRIRAYGTLLAALGAMGASLAAHLAPGWTFVALIAGTLGGFVLLKRVFAKWAVRFVPTGLTVGDLARITALPSDGAVTPAVHWSRARIAEDVRVLVVRASGSTIFSDDSDFIRDLGMG